LQKGYLQISGKFKDISLALQSCCSSLPRPQQTAGGVLRYGTPFGPD
jgi:hypothetical protein